VAAIVTAVRARYGRAAAAVRWQESGSPIWLALVPGLVVMGALNLLVLGASWAQYRRPWTVLLAWLLISVTAALVWLRSRDGLGPVPCLLALAAAVGAQVWVAGELAGADPLGLANWSTGYSALALVLVPFSRPPEEVAAHVVTLAATGGTVLAGAAHGLRGQHLLVMSAGSGPTIVCGSALLIAALRRILTRAGALRDMALDERAHRDARESMDELLRTQAEASDQEAAALLDGLASGVLRPDAPETVRRCREVSTALRTELGLRARRTWLQALLLSDLRARGLPPECLVVFDDDDLGPRLRPRDRRLLREAALDVLDAGNTGARLTLMAGDCPGEAVLVLRADGGPVPRTPTWRALARRRRAALTRGTGRHWFFDCPIVLGSAEGAPRHPVRPDPSSQHLALRAVPGERHEERG
jgi:hypothetical protein